MANVLVVEDSATELALVAGYLQQAGILVTSAKSVEEAQDKLDLKSLDLILLDVILPGQSGFELCRELKSNPDTKSIPIIICSTKDTEVDKMYGNMLGADAYLCKPVQKQDLLQTVRRLIGR